MMGSILAQGTAETLGGIGGTAVIASIFIRWLMARSDRDAQAAREDSAKKDQAHREEVQRIFDAHREEIKGRNAVIESLASNAIKAQNETIRVLQEVSDTLKGCPNNRAPKQGQET